MLPFSGFSSVGEDKKRLAVESEIFSILYKRKISFYPKWRVSIGEQTTVEYDLFVK